MIDTPSSTSTSGNGTGLVHTPAAPRHGLVRPIATPQEILDAQTETRELVAKALVADRDYGKIPGTDKKTLLKPGAERVAMGFGCVPRFTILEKEIDHDRAVRWHKVRWVVDGRGNKPVNWLELKEQGLGRNKQFDGVWKWQRKVEEDGLSLGLYRYVVRCELVHRESGQVVGDCIGTCSTLEAKYIDRPRDAENTVVKMAQKRSFVGATLVAFGLSDQFTQDVEDAVVEEIPASGDELPADADGVSTDQADQADQADGRRVNATADVPSCPKCGGLMWDNRFSKRNPKAPDYKCRSRSCDGTIWPGQWPPAPAASEAQRAEIERLLPTAKFKQARSRGKVAEKLADAEHPLNAKDADELIQKLKGLQPTGSDKAADELKARQDAAKGDPANGDPANGDPANGDPAQDPNTAQSTLAELPF